MADVEITLVVEPGGVKRLVDALLCAHVVLDLFVGAMRVEVAGDASRQHVAGALPRASASLRPNKAISDGRGNIGGSGYR